VRQIVSGVTRPFDCGKPWPSSKRDNWRDDRRRGARERREIGFRIDVVEFAALNEGSDDCLPENPRTGANARTYAGTRVAYKVLTPPLDAVNGMLIWCSKRSGNEPGRGRGSTCV
jgi:hypothetical protein